MSHSAYQNSSLRYIHIIHSLHSTGWKKNLSTGPFFPYIVSRIVFFYSYMTESGINQIYYRRWNKNHFARYMLMFVCVCRVCVCCCRCCFCCCCCCGKIFTFDIRIRTESSEKKIWETIYFMIIIINIIILFHVRIWFEYNNTQSARTNRSYMCVVRERMRLIQWGWVLVGCI